MIYNEDRKPDKFCVQFRPEFFPLWYDIVSCSIFHINDTFEYVKLTEDIEQR